MHTRFHFIRECVEKELIEVEHIYKHEQKADILTNALRRIKFKEMRELIGVQDVLTNDFKLKGENVGLSLKITWATSHILILPSNGNRVANMFRSFT